MCEGLISTVIIAVGVRSHYILQPSSALSLLLKPTASKELLLPCSLSPSMQQNPAPEAVQAVQVGQGGIAEVMQAHKSRSSFVLGKKYQEMSMKLF